MRELGSDARTRRFFHFPVLFPFTFFEVGFDAAVRRLLRTFWPKERCLHFRTIWQKALHRKVLRYVPSFSVMSSRSTGRLNINAYTYKNENLKNRKLKRKRKQKRKRGSLREGREAPPRSCPHPFRFRFNVRFFNFLFLYVYALIFNRPVLSTKTISFACCMR